MPYFMDAEVRSLVVDTFRRLSEDGLREKVLPVLERGDFSKLGEPDYLRQDGDQWTVYHALAVLAPLSSRYLDIGVRRGWSIAVALAANPNLRVWGVDLWSDANYGGYPNPGPEFVQKEMRALFPDTRELALIKDTSQNVLPKRPDGSFDLVLVDGAHTRNEVVKDLVEGWRVLERGGWMLVDDVNYWPVWDALREFLEAHEVEREGRTTYGVGAAVLMKP